MRKKRPRVAMPDEVKITRQGDEAIIEFLDPDIATTHLRIGPEVHSMSDEEILDVFNEGQMFMELRAKADKYVAVEVPEGSEQIRYHQDAYQWVPRGGVLRCVIGDDVEGEAIIHIDDHELSLAEFGRLLTTYAGWGMRIVFVADDETAKTPRIEIREPEELDAT